MSTIAQLSFGRYYPALSFVHSMDPRYKLIITLLFGGIIMSSSNFLGVILSAVPIVIIIYFSKIPFSWMLKSVKPFFYIFVFTFLIHIFFTGGPSLLDLGYFSVSRDGFMEASFVNLRLFILLVGASILTLSTTPTRLASGIEFLLAPLKMLRLPVSEIALMISIALAFIPLLIVESDKIIKAQICRGARFSSGSLISRAKNLAPIAIPLFYRMFKLSTDLSIAMESRGYVVGRKRTRYKELSGNRYDVTALLVVTAYLLIVFWSTNRLY